MAGGLRFMSNMMKITTFSQAENPVNQKIIMVKVKIY